LPTGSRVTVSSERVHCSQQQEVDGNAVRAGPLRPAHRLYAAPAVARERRRVRPVTTEKQPGEEPPRADFWATAGTMLAVVSVVVSLIATVPLLVRGVAAVELGVALLAGVLLLITGLEASRWDRARREEGRPTSDGARTRREMATPPVPIKRDRGPRSAMTQTSAPPGREREPSSAAGQPDASRSLGRHYDGERARGWNPARRGITAGGAALSLAFLTGIGTTIAADVAAATHIAQTAGVPSETCTEAVEQVSRLARENPEVAARYARGELGLPTLVELDVEKRCGGSFRTLLRGAAK
jgi:hypothetical protein